MAILENLFFDQKTHRLQGHNLKIGPKSAWASPTEPKTWPGSTDISRPPITDKVGNVGRRNKPTCGKVGTISDIKCKNAIFDCGLAETH
jgi:hypothetical protein